MNDKEFLGLAIRSLIGYCWFCLTNSLFFLVKFIAQHVFRIKKQDRDSGQRGFDDFGGEEEHEEPSNFSFKFEHQIPKMSATNIAKISNYRISSERDFCGFVENPKVLTLQVHEPFIESAEDLEKLSIQSKGVILLKDQEIEERKATVLETNSLDEKEVDACFDGFDLDSDSIDSISLSDGCSMQGLAVDSESDGVFSGRDFVDDKESLIDSTAFEVELMENVKKLEEEIREAEEPSSSNLQINLVDSSVNEPPYSINDTNDLDYSSFPCEEYVLNYLGLNAEFSGYNGYHRLPSRVFKGNENRMIEEKSEETESDDSKILDHLKSVHQENMHKILDVNPDFNSTNCDHYVLGRDSEGYESKTKEEKYEDIESNESKNLDCSYFVDREHVQKILDSSASRDIANGDHQALKRDSDEYEHKRKEEKFEETQLKDLDYDDLDELDSRQDLIEMLKLELKRARAGGLPTIFEESESPRGIEDLKPWKFDEKSWKEDPIDELHRLYESYKERMRKLDTLNCQKMSAIGFLQLKNPLASTGARKPLIPTIISHLSQNSKPSSRQKSTIDPSENFMKELQIDLERVYVGQTCLSWEFLQWQCKKVRELANSGPHRNRRYNEVAGEFQRFQVMVQRFIENEPFEGPRLQNYVQNRCVLRNLLQVPVIKEDCMKDKLGERKNGIFGITLETLEDIMEETTRLFWEFIKADKDETSIFIFKGLIRYQVELQDPSDFRLMSDIQASLQKKEKILKEVVKRGNCLVKRFKKPQEDRRSNHDVFFSQIEMKLISRVLRMSRITTDQLVWCHQKLSKITTGRRKIHREPSFLLFPC